MSFTNFVLQWCDRIVAGRWGQLPASWTIPAATRAVPAAASVWTTAAAAGGRLRLGDQELHSVRPDPVRLDPL